MTSNGSNNNPPSNNGSNNNPPSNNNGNNNSNTTTKCSHNWVEQFKTVHHDEVGHYEDVQVLVKDAWTETVYHAAEYTTERKWVVDSAAYDEQVTTGWKCSICGETK